MEEPSTQSEAEHTRLFARTADSLSALSRSLVSHSPVAESAKSNELVYVGANMVNIPLGYGYRSKCQQGECADGEDQWPGWLHALYRAVRGPA